jgi:hypothetical protein
MKGVDENIALLRAKYSAWRRNVGGSVIKILSKSIDRNEISSKCHQNNIKA